MKWVAEEDHSEAADRLRRAHIVLCAPDLLGPELGNALWKKIRRSELDPSDVANALLVLAEVELHPSAALIEHAVHLAVVLHRTVYDCTYLALALTLHCPLVTADRKFYAAVAASALASHIRFVEDAS